MSCHNFENVLTPTFHSSGSSKFNFLHLGYRNPPPPKASLDEADLIPEANANWLSLLTFEWISPLMKLGYSRPLEATDLYKLQDSRSSGVIAERITTSFEKRLKNAAEYNARLANGEISPGLKGIWWSIRGQRQEREKEWREKTGRKKANFAFAVNDSVFWFFWSAGIFRLISDVSLITSPLLVKVFSFPLLRAPPILTPLRLLFGSPSTPTSQTALDRKPLHSNAASVTPLVSSSSRFWPLSL